MNISEDRLEAGDRRAMAQDIVLGEMVAKHAILVEVLVQIAFRHRAWPLGWVHGDEVIRNGSSGTASWPSVSPSFVQLPTGPMQSRQCSGAVGLDLATMTVARTMEHFGEGCEGLDNTTRASWLKTCEHLASVSVPKGKRASPFGQYFQSVKKLYAARYFEYRVALVMDADTIFVKPISLPTLFTNEAASLVTTQRDSGELAQGCMSMLLNASDGEVIASKAPKLGYRRGAYLKAVARSPRAMLEAFAPFTTPWGVLSWFWAKPTIVDLFEHVHERHGIPLAERLNAVISIPLEILDDMGRVEWSRLRCYEAMLYWLFVLVREAKRRPGEPGAFNTSELVWPELTAPESNRGDASGMIRGPRPLQGSPHSGADSPKPARGGDISRRYAGWARPGQQERLYWATPNLLMKRYFPQLRNESIAIRGFERSLMLLFVANTSEPFNGWLRHVPGCEAVLFHIASPPRSG